MVESSCLLSNWPGQPGPWVRIPASPPKFASMRTLANFGETSPVKNCKIIFDEAGPPYSNKYALRLYFAQ